MLYKQTTVGSMILGMAPSVKVDALASVMLKLALDGSERHRILENVNINELSKQV